MRFEERVAIINREFGYNIDPRGNLDLYWRTIKILRLNVHKLRDMSEQDLINCVNYYKLNQEERQHQQRKNELFNKIKLCG